MDGVDFGGKATYSLDTQCCGGDGDDKDGGVTVKTLLYKEEKSAVEVYNDLQKSSRIDGEGRKVLRDDPNASKKLGLFARLFSNMKR